MSKAAGPNDSVPSATGAKGGKPDRTVKPGAILRAMQAEKRADLPQLMPDVDQSVVNGRSESDDSAATSIHVERDGDQISRIVAACACGREIVIQCDYAASPSPAPSDPAGGSP